MLLARVVDNKNTRAELGPPRAKAIQCSVSEAIERNSENAYFEEVHQPVTGIGQQRLNITGYGPTLTCTRFTFAGVRGEKDASASCMDVGNFFSRSTAGTHQH